MSAFRTSIAFLGKMQPIMNTAALVMAVIWYSENGRARVKYSKLEEEEQRLNTQYYSMWTLAQDKEWLQQTTTLVKDSNNSGKLQQELAELCSKYGLAPKKNDE